MSIYLTAACALGVYMFGAFVLSLLRRDNGIADIAYGGGFILLAVVSLLLSVPTAGGVLATALAVVWGTRLSVRIWKRNHGKPEDFRYRTWREQWGKWFVLRSFFQVYVLQGVIIYVVASPVVFLNIVGPPLDTVALVFLALWGVGFLFEAMGDYQLDRFIRTPHEPGAVMSEGLWRYTRHPNYFGESLMWWSLGLFAYAATGSVLALVSPALITFLLLKVSGVPLLEARFAGNPQWEAYKARTSMFFPLPPKKV